ncbi:MAG: multidrug efflux SMR transporter [Candidatus Sericytochromatia bacterium]
MSWFYLVLAIVLEVASTVAMKYSDGFRNILPSFLMMAFSLSSFCLVTLALKRIDVGTAYAIWSGVGTSMITVIGYFAFKESLDIVKMGSIIMIIVGVAGLNLTGSAHN